MTFFCFPWALFEPIYFPQNLTLNPWVCFSFFWRRAVSRVSLGRGKSKTFFLSIPPWKNVEKASLQKPYIIQEQFKFFACMFDQPGQASSVRMYAPFFFPLHMVGVSGKVVVFPLINRDAFQMSWLRSSFGSHLSRHPVKVLLLGWRFGVWERCGQMNMGDFISTVKLLFSL